jgi:hypothetical protein
MRRGRGHHLAPPQFSLSAGKNTFQRQKAPSQGQKYVVNHSCKYDLVELAGSGIPRAKTGPAADWQRNLVPASLEHGTCLILCAFLMVVHLIIDIVALILHIGARPTSARGPAASASNKVKE